MLKKHLHTILFISWVVFVTLLSLFSSPDIGEGGIRIPNADKIVHFIFYCGMVALGTLFLREKTNAFDVGKHTIWALVFAISYGVLMEILQHIMPFERAAEIWDVLANTLGAIFGVLLIKKYLSLIAKLK